MEERLADALARTLAAIEAGEDVDAEWFHVRYPEHAEELREMLALRGVLRRDRRSRVDPYAIESTVGEGSTGTVYLVRLTEATAGLEAGRRVALKRMRPHLAHEKRNVEQFLQEARVGMRIRHPNVVRVYDCGTTDHGGERVPYLIREYVEGQTLRALLQELGTVPESLCRHVGAHLARALSAVHEAGAVHRDVKPENVILTAAQDVKLMDLGAALTVRDRESARGAFVGSAWYAAPEQLHPEPTSLDARADLFSLGLVLAELSTGRHRLLGRRAGEWNAQLTPFFEEILSTLLAADPDHRFSSAAEVADALEAGEESTWWRVRSVQVPRRRVRIPRETGLYGRADVLRELHDAFRDAREGRGRLVLLEGEAGIGKSRTTDELLEGLRARGDDFEVLLGAFEPGDEGRDALVTVLRDRFGPDAASIRRHLDGLPGLADDLESYLGFDGERPRGPAEQSAVDTAVVYLLRALARSRTVILVVEDLHLAPPESWKRFLALRASLGDARVLLLGCLRPRTQDADVSPSVTVVRLEGLGAAAQRELAAEFLAPNRLGDELAAELGRFSGGNPLFLLQMLRSLEQRGVLQEDGNGELSLRGGASLQVPRAVDELVLERVRALPSNVRGLLGAAACVGNEFDPGLLADALERPVLPLLQELARIGRRHGLLQAVGPFFRFNHHVVYQALQGQLDPKARAELHGKIGRALEARRGPGLRGQDALVAFRHYLDAGLRASAKRHLDEALDFLRRTHQHSLRAELCARVLGIVSDFEARGALLLERADALRLVGRLADQETVLGELVHEARGASSARLEIEALIRRAQTRRSLCHWDELEEDLNRAKEIAELLSPSYVTAVVVETGAARMARGDFETAHVLLAQARDAYVALGDPVGQARALHDLGRALTIMGRLDDGRRVCEECVAVCTSMSDGPGRARALNALGQAGYRLGDFEEARLRFMESRDLMRELGDRGGEASSCSWLAIVATITGNASESLRWLDQTIRLYGETGNVLGEAIALSNMALVLKSQGRYAEAIETALRNDDLYATLSIVEQRAVNQCALARCHGQLGAWGPARDYFQSAYELCAKMSTDLGCNAIELYRLAAEIDGDADPRALLAESQALLVRMRTVGADSETALAVFLCVESLWRLGRPEAAVAALQEAGELSGSLPDNVARYAAFQGVLGQIDVREASGRIARIRPRMTLHAWLKVNYLLWKAGSASEHLEAAHNALLRIREGAPSELRAGVIPNVRLYREIAAAVSEL